MGFDNQHFSAKMFPNIEKEDKDSREDGQSRGENWLSKKVCIKDNCHHMKTRRKHCDSGIEEV